ncbi:polysaccharide biosynthesis tyrosine autokinase [Agromyces archimandritae]|uniref:non-specific protein-tyrosine kinase n=1 Tax=Agromyces archimandritae TaxID=2781962 RepID=A0A975IPA3_9MICO|nr:polysaccharide biosynthesis tyrosine autokinase [Agromyces archimandritae]QTX05437.1 polysaccharide biosynthesis tyrosine autokinase [Agromyces archimandritae]
MEFSAYLRILRKNWIVILVLAVLGAAAGLTVSLLQTPDYRSSAKVFVSTSGGDTVADLQQGNTFTQQRVKTYADLATTPIVLLPVVAELGLDMSAEELAREVQATAPLDTTLIEITATDADPAAAAEIATAVSESLTSVVASIESTGNDEVSPVRLTLVQHAAVPQRPVSPNLPLNVALGALLGLIVGVVVALVRDALDTRVRGEHDIAQIADAPVIGGIADDPRASERPLIVHDDPHSQRAESFRTLRTNVSFLEPGRSTRAFVVTSSIEAEGKTTTAANLAIALADAGADVLLVDGDLRKPKVAGYLGIEGAAGLTDVLIGRADVDDVVQPWGRAGLSVLPAGRVPPNPSELLGSAAMAELVERLGESHDVVLYDAPPLLPVTDGAVLARLVGGAIVVAGTGRVRKAQLKAALGALESVGAPVSGIVLTMLPTRGPDAYGYRRYAYGAGYAYGVSPELR